MQANLHVTNKSKLRPPRALVSLLATCMRRHCRGEHPYSRYQSQRGKVAGPCTTKPLKPQRDFSRYLIV